MLLHLGQQLETMWRNEFSSTRWWSWCRKIAADGCAFLVIIHMLHFHSLGRGGYRNAPAIAYKNGILSTALSSVFHCTLIIGRNCDFVYSDENNTVNPISSTHRQDHSMLIHIHIDLLFLCIYQSCNMDRVS